MRKRVFGRRFKRDTNARKALFRNLMRDLILHERIKTTEARAKAIRGEVEKLITRAKRKGEAARRDITKIVVHPPLVEKVIANLAPRFASRPGGYTRIVRLGERVKDAAPLVMIEWVETSAVAVPVSAESPEEKKSARRQAQKSEKIEKKTKGKKEKKR